MDIVTIEMEIPAEAERNLSGMQDHYIKNIESEYQVDIINRGGTVKIKGEESKVHRVENIINQLLSLAQNGTEIEEQNVNYAISLGAEEKEGLLSEIDSDCICHTINGKPVKPKTLGQKKYVDAIRNNMIVFGLGPAGTGKRYTNYIKKC